LYAQTMDIVDIHLLSPQRPLKHNFENGTSGDEIKNKSGDKIKTNKFNNVFCYE
jgi:hypothetical protein